MYASGGVGIAAPQLGVPARLFVYNTDPTAPGGRARARTVAEVDALFDPEDVLSVFDQVIV